MALSKEKWLEIQGYYEAGLSLSQITQKVKINKSTISRMAKKQQWKQGKNSDYIEAKEVIARKKATENQHLLHFADIVAEDKIRQKNLISNTTELVVKKVNDLVVSGKAQKVVTTSNGELGSSAEVVKYDLQAKDYKDAVDAIDKASVTLGINPRFAQGINIQNNNQNNQLSKIDINFLDED